MTLTWVPLRIVTCMGEKDWNSKEGSRFKDFNKDNAVLNNSSLIIIDV